MTTLSVVGIILSLALIVILALRGVHIMLIAPFGVVIVALFSQMGVLETLTGPYMQGFVNYASRYYLIFLFASIFGKFMDDSGAARSIANGILKIIGRKNALYSLYAIAVVTLVLTLGGVSLFVVIFAVMPIARPIFKEMDVPWHLFMAPFMFGIGSLSMSMIPGTPSTLNIMPMVYLGTPATAAPVIGIFASILMLTLNLLYMRYALNRARAKDEHYEDPVVTGKTEDVSYENLPHMVLSLIPPIILIACLNVIRLDIVWSLVVGCVSAEVFFFKYIKNPMATINAGALNTALPIINTCADVGYGMAVAASAGFTVIKNVLLSIPGPATISLCIATYLMAAITGSASGGLGIILETVIQPYVDMGINPELLHRIVCIAAGSFDAMPHNGVVITSLAVAGLTHKLAYRHIFWPHVMATLIVMIPTIILATIIY
ncbi:MAG: GntP family permease [Gracilibacteraceae bacterium]|nr:GntP family permease [Gracilibacteraceae bacterium]